MGNLIDEIKHDLRFLRSHTLQPRWWKILKIPLLLGSVAGDYLLFGLTATLVFYAVFLSLMFGVHLVYRSKTKKYTTSWLGFTVPQEGQRPEPKRIGIVCYTFIALNAILPLIVSQVLS